MLTGGRDNDVFIFRDGDGQDTVRDFATGDKIDVSAFGFTTIADIAISRGSKPKDTLIQFDADDSVVLVGVDWTTLQQDDFIFA